MAESEEINRLQNQVTELQNQVESLEIKLKLARKRHKEFEEELAKVERENHDLKHGVVMQRVVDQLRLSQFEVQGLRQENQKLQNNLGNSLQPDYEAARDRALNKLKVGRQSSAGKAIDAFIKELQRG